MSKSGLHDPATKTKDKRLQPVLSLSDQYTIRLVQILRKPLHPANQSH